ncbi:uncharacterized protein LOC115456967 isoform X2 [Microcaecilia unicolor]|nr:uncharacterized protein LOC115456967 isoform X2 [Microcaecilia unicolor]XP_030042237.1 uncharacterized protein LOC115456967 isoform X2 [Microcaecilia unicolor]
MQEEQATSQEVFTMDRELIESVEWRIFRTLVEVQSNNLQRRMSIVESLQHSETEVSVEGFASQVKQAGQAIRDFQKRWSLVKEKFFVTPAEVTLWKSLKKTMNLPVWRVEVNCMLEQEYASLHICGPRDIVKVAMNAISKVLYLVSSYMKGASRPNSDLSTHPKVVSLFQSLNDLTVFVWKGNPSNLRQDAIMIISHGEHALHHNMPPGIISRVSQNSMTLFRQCVLSNRRTPQTIFHLIFHDLQTDHDDSTKHLLTSGIICSLERAAQDNFQSLAVLCCDLIGETTAHMECIVLAMEAFFSMQPRCPLQSIAFVAKEDAAIANIQNVCLKHYSQRKDMHYLLPKILLSLKDVKTEVVTESIKDQKTDVVVFPFISQGSRISPLCPQGDFLNFRKILGSLLEVGELPVGEVVSIPATHIPGVSCQVIYIIRLDEELFQENRAKEAIHQLVHSSLLSLYSSFFESIAIPLLESDSLGQFSRDRVLQTMLEEIDQFTIGRPCTWIRYVKVLCPPGMPAPDTLIDENLNCAETLGFFLMDDPIYVRYLYNHRAVLKTFKSSFQRHQCQLRICQQRRILQFIPVNSRFPNWRQLFHWRSTCEATFQAMRCNYTVHYEKDPELLVMLHKHPSVLNEFPSIRLYEQMCLIGLKDEVRMAQQILKSMVFQKKQITSQHPVPHLLRCIIVKDVMEKELETSCPNVTIELEEDCRVITFEGPRWQVALLQRRFQELLNAFHSTPLSISSYQYSFIQAFGMEKFSRRFFLDRDIAAFLELLPRSGDMSSLGIFGLNCETLRAAEKQFQSLMFQVNIGISEAAVRWVADMEWQTLLQRLEEEGKIAVYPVESANGTLKEVALVGFEPNVSNKEAILKEFLQEFSPVEERLELTRQELVDVGQDLLKTMNWRNLNVITDVATLHGSTSLVVSGLQKHVRAARAIIRADLQAITFDTVPITSTLCQYFEESGAEILQKLSLELQCIIQLRVGPPGDAMSSLQEQKMVPQEEHQSLLKRCPEGINDAGDHAASAVYIFGRPNEVAKAKEAIHIFTERFWEETVTSPFIPAIQEDNWNSILERPFQFPLKWLLRGNCITIQGTCHSVIEALKVIQLHLHKKELSLAVAEELSKSVQWYYESDPRYLPFDLEANYQLETRYRKQKERAEVLLGAERATVDLKQQKASVTNTRTTLKIKRRVYGSEPDIPSHWEPMQDCLSKRVELPVTSDEYKKVANRFHQTAENISIIKIERIQNPYLWLFYCCKRSWLEKKNPPGLQNEQLLFHGTQTSTCDSIQKIGFNSRFNKDCVDTKPMEYTNFTAVSMFILAGFDDIPAPSGFLFVLFLGIYLVTLGGNLLILVITRRDPNLHTPMCFFLGNLSFLDICYISTTVPKMCEVLLSEKTISKTGCAFQLYFIIFFETIECYLLAMMAYDRYIAISNPLRYTTIMSPRLCLQMSTLSWIVGVINAFIHTRLTFQVVFCGPNRINHFFCDIPPLLKLSCSDTTLNELVLYGVGGVFVGLGPFLFILVSYGFILSTILRMSSAKGRQKAFSTCASHIIVLTIFYGVGSFNYVRPRASYSLNRDKLVSAFYNIIIPMLNPIIYSLRNGEIRGALRDALRRQVKTAKL